jgi:chromosome segregation and condensation protein ScpB
MRGLVRRVSNPKDERSFLYEPTTELFAEMGITHARDLPDFRDVKEKLTALERAYKEGASSDSAS